MTTREYAAIGFVFVTLLAWILGWLVPKLVGHSIESSLAKKERADQEYRNEQIEDAIRQQKGQQVITNSLLVILRHMITGNHIEDLERAQGDLQAFNNENEAALRRKAAKYNLR